MSFIIRNAWREIRNNRPFCIFYLVNLSLGLTGFIGVDSFKASLKNKVEIESKQLLGADLAIRARRDFTKEEIDAARKVLPAGTMEVKAVDFFSMAAGPSGKSRLIKIVAFENGFPFYGLFKTKLSGELSGEDETLLHQKKIAWIYPELKSQLDIDLGEELKIGASEFRVTDYVIEETGLSFQPAELAPKAFISYKFLEETNLLSEGNTAFRNYLFKLPKGTDPESIAILLRQAIVTTDLQVYSHHKVGHRAGRLLRYLSDFLAIVSMVALFLACLGGGYLYKGFFNQRIKDIAILVCLGACKKKALQTYFAQLSILGAAAVIPAVLLSFLVIPLLSGVLGTFVPIDLKANLSIGSIISALIVAIFGGWLIALPSLWNISCLKPADLFRESSITGTNVKKSSLFFTLPGILGFWALCCFQAQSFKLANLFFLSLLGSVFVLFIFARIVIFLSDRLSNKAALPFRLATRSLARNRASTITGFLALGIGVLLLNLIPQFHYLLKNEIEPTGHPSKLPKLFLFDIQEEQLFPLKEALEESGKNLENITPWIRGKLLSINGKKYEQSIQSDQEFQNPEDERRSNFRNRSFNLSYRDHLLKSEQIVKGKMVSMTFDPNSSKVAEISVAAKYADSLKLDLKDRLMIEVSGVPIKAEIVNIRRVKWTSFQPNFFVQMQPGVLEDAPKTFIATVHDLDSDEKQKLQDQLVKQFPTISILDIERTGQKILEIISQMTWALQLMASLSILAGIIVLHSLAREKARQQRWDLNLLKILGASFNDLKNLVRIEFGLLSFMASFLGSILSLAISFLLADQVFDRVWSFHPILPFSIIFGVTFLGLLVSEIATRKVLNESPTSLLGER